MSPPKDEGKLVETPGTAPGSDPLIASAFISIVPKDTLYLGGLGGEFNTWYRLLGAAKVT